MHELGVVFHVADTIENLAVENKVERVTAVTIEVGEVSGIIHEYLIDCWNWAASKRPVLNGCEMKIETIHALTHCDGCGGQYDTVPNGKICPLCGSDRTWLITGNEFRIKEMEVDDP